MVKKAECKNGVGRYLDGNRYLEQHQDQLRAEAQIEQLLRHRNQEFSGLTELERLTKRILKLKFAGFQLEIRRWVTQ